MVSIAIAAVHVPAHEGVDHEGVDVKARWRYASK
jgi:hypothetical protein